jgi:DNA-binding MurR/RpiR family transcriptional regulator
MTGTLEERLAAAADLTPAERTLAGWFEDHLRMLPFESAASIAAAAGVSEMTVIRFVRQLGYANLKTLKAELKARAEVADVGLDDRWSRFRVPGGDADMAESLRLEIASLVSVYDLAGSPAWRRAIDAATAAERLHVAGFQASKGLALDFSTRLRFVRPGVRFAEGLSGTWSEIFGEEPAGSCVFLVDTAAYCPTSFRIAELCADGGIPLIVATDRFGDWARGYTDMALTVSTQARTFWDSPTPLACMLNLFLDGVSRSIGQPARDRVERLRALGDHFESFAFEPPRRARAGRRQDTETRRP